MAAPKVLPGRAQSSAPAPAAGEPELLELPRLESGDRATRDGSEGHYEATPERKKTELHRGSGSPAPAALVERLRRARCERPV